MISPPTIALIAGSALIATTGTVANLDESALQASVEIGREDDAEAPVIQDGAGADRDGIQLENSLAQDARGGRSARETPISIVREGSPIYFGSLNEAVASARSGETILIAGDAIITAPIVIDDGRSIALRATGPCGITRSQDFPLSGGKIAGMVKVSKNSELLMSADAASGAALTLDGQKQDSLEALITVDGGGSVTVGDSVSVVNAASSSKPWAGTYVKNGSFILDGGSISDNSAARNAATAVEAAGTFIMRGGEITRNHSSNSSSALWVKGTLRISGGTISGNTSNSGADGIIYVHGGGTLDFTGGTVTDNPSPARYGILSDNAHVTLGGTAHMGEGEGIGLKGDDDLGFSSGLETHDVADPIQITLLETWDKGRTVASFGSPEDAKKGLSYLSVKAGEQNALTLSLEVDPSDPNRLRIAAGESAAIFDLLDNPYADNLGLSLKPELQGTENRDLLRKRLEEIFQDVETPEKTYRFEQLDHIDRYESYLSANKAEVENSVLTLSRLGDPVQDRNRTKQNFMFDNLDITGLYLEPGRVNEFLLFVDADDPGLLSLAWRQVGLTENNNFNSLNLQQYSRLENGVNRISIDLTGKTYGYMLYLRNDSSANNARARFEGIDASLPDTPSIVGTQLKRHSFYIHDVHDPEAFWSFVQDVREQSEGVRSGTSQDMAVLQMGDDGRAQFAIRATALEKAYSGISSPQDAVSYITASNDAIQERLDFFWDFDGFEKGIAEGPNAASAMRVHTAFSKTVSYPSTMYATGRYFHMPESSAASFLSGASMYGWGMSHEYGHVLDNSVTVVNEETNNMYSIAGARHGEILASERNGTEFSPTRAYHGNALRAESLRDEELARMAADPSYRPDWNEGGWGRYIWAHVTAWWNGLHFFDEWDYSGYDHSASPFTEQDAQQVMEHGAFGATMRILRGDADAVRTIEQTTSSIKDGTSRKYNRIAMAYTMGTGYDFSEYLELLGQRDLSEEVKAFCARYPSMPRKVQYYSLTADAARINGAVPYAGEARPCVRLSQTGGDARIEAHMHQDEQQAATIAWELYIDGELSGFSRNGSFSLQSDERLDPDRVEVIGYDVRLNPSERASADKAPISVTFPEMRAGETEKELVVEVKGAPKGSKLTYSVEDESVLTIDGEGRITPGNAGSSAVEITIQRSDGAVEGPFRFTATVLPRELVLQVGDAVMFTGQPMPRPNVKIVEGSLMDSDELGDIDYSALDGNGAVADLSRKGTYSLHADIGGLGPNYQVTVRPGSLNVRQDEAELSWVELRDPTGRRVEHGSWSTGPITLSPANAKGAAGTYDRILGYEAGLEGPTIESEGVITQEVRLVTTEGDHVGAQSSPISVPVRIDGTAPAVEITIEERNDGNGKTAHIALRATDEAPEGVEETSGVESIAVLVRDEGGEVVREEEFDGSSASFALKEPGAYSIEVSSRDRAGNESDPVKRETTVDREDGTPDAGGEDGAPDAGGDSSPGPGANPSPGPGDRQTEPSGSPSLNGGDADGRKAGTKPSSVPNGRKEDMGSIGPESADTRRESKANGSTGPSPHSGERDGRIVPLIGIPSIIIALIIVAAIRLSRTHSS